MFFALLLAACSTSEPVPTPAEAPTEAPAEAPAGKMSAEAFAQCEAAVKAARGADTDHPSGTDRKPVLDAVAAAKSSCLGVHNDDITWLDELSVKLAAEASPHPG